MKKIKGINSDSDPSKLPETEYKYMPNATATKQVDRLTLDFYSCDPRDKTMNTLDVDGVTIEQPDNNSVYLKKEIAIEIAKFILKGYNIEQSNN